MVILLVGAVLSVSALARYVEALSFCVEAGSDGRGFEERKNSELQHSTRRKRYKCEGCEMD